MKLKHKKLGYVLSVITPYKNGRLDCIVTDTNGVSGLDVGNKLTISADSICGEYFDEVPADEMCPDPRPGH